MAISRLLAISYLIAYSLTRHVLNPQAVNLTYDVLEPNIFMEDGKLMGLKIYVFSPGRYAFNDNFREVEEKVELVALPAAIYDAYQKVLPKRKEKLLELESKEETKIPTDLFEGQGV